MKEELITLETAKLAKEKKCNAPGFIFYNKDGYLIEEDSIHPEVYSNDRIDEITNIHATAYNGYMAPTQSLLQRWLREIHKIHIEISPASDVEYGVILGTVEETEWIREYNEVMYFPTYEQALERGLYNALKLI